MPRSDLPTARDLDALLDRLGPEIARRFHDRGLSAAEASARIAQALTELAYRWNRVGDRESWLLDFLDRDPEPKEPRHE